MLRQYKWRSCSHDVCFFTFFRLFHAIGIAFEIKRNVVLSAIDQAALHFFECGNGNFKIGEAGNEDRLVELVVPEVASAKIGAGHLEYVAAEKRDQLFRAGEHT